MTLVEKYVASPFEICVRHVGQNPGHVSSGVGVAVVLTNGKKGLGINSQLCLCHNMVNLLHLAKLAPLAVDIPLLIKYSVQCVSLYIHIGVLRRNPKSDLP